ncbi:MAG: hypothetical protein CM15mP89_2330 [Gammaproteobacteria bacterium]|nr:MAG: hypothetical protein CM15mP89_2330 [Gammaproteobacteria bacterium]
MGGVLFGGQSEPRSRRGGLIDYQCRGGFQGHWDLRQKPVTGGARLSPLGRHPPGAWGKPMVYGAVTIVAPRLDSDAAVWERLDPPPVASQGLGSNFYLAGPILCAHRAWVLNFS